MRNEITAMKLKIMQVLYVEKCIPSSQIELYAMYLQTKGIQIGPTYLYRILRELITVKYVERIRVGYQQKGVSIKSLEGKSGYKIKNIYRLTAAGRHYIESEDLTILNKELREDMCEELDIRLKEGQVKQGNRERKKCEANGEKENLIILKGNLVGDTEKAEPSTEKASGQVAKESAGFVMQSALNNERAVRLIKTELFGKVSEIGRENVKYISNEKLRSSIKNKGALASKITGLMQIRDAESNTHFLPIYNLGGSVGSQSKKTERKMKSEIENKYNTEISEEILLGENYETLLYNIETLLTRKQAKRKDGSNGRRIKSLMIEPDEAHYTVKYYHNIDINGTEQMGIYNIPQKVRRAYYQQRLREEQETKRYFSREAIEMASGSIYSAKTETENVYVGYELNIGELVQLMTLMNGTAGERKKIIIICQESQRSLYEKLTKRVGVEEDTKIIATPYYI